MFPKHRPTQRAPSARETLRVFELILRYGKFPFSSFVLPSRW